MSILSIIIPVYNEANTIYPVLKIINNVTLINNIKKEIIIINDCSTDNSENLIFDFMSKSKDANIKYFKQNRNTGKGAAIKTGISKATGNYLIIQDADLEYDPNDYNVLLEPIINGHADVVYGSRFKNKPSNTMFFWQKTGNKVLTFISNLFTKFDLSDMETCYKLFKTEQIKSLHLHENGFGFEPEITAKLSKIPDITIREVGVSFNCRTKKEGKKIRFKDGLRALYCIVNYWIK
ncbi:MAG: glycosyltransferase family 2 protein [Candidatus Delongbacteria bacterium]|jgi:glycosyltransferase involved in cell wall biosynthesis|nr:glycosyltransferase family 2 protein [Candidatus Delongbacteria bacterium]